MKARARVKGIKTVQRNMAKLGEQGVDAFRGAVYAEGLSIIDEAVQNVPKVTGRLSNSHWVSHPSKSGKVTIGFATKYAAAVEFGLRLIKVAREQQKAAFAAMRKSRWRKSKVGGPYYFRNAIYSHKGGSVNRIARTAKRYFNLKIGFIPRPEEPKTESSARSKGRLAWPLGG